MLRKILLAIPLLWLMLVVATGFYADGGGGPVAGLAAAAAIACLYASLRGWWHLAAMPLYVFFAFAIVVSARFLVA